MPVAFGLKADHEATFTGGVLNVPPGRDFNVGRALQDGNGTIVVDDTDNALITVLDQVTELKRVTVPEKVEPVDPYADLSAQQLRDEVKARGLEGVGASKDDMRAALRDHDNTTGEGE